MDLDEEIRLGNQHLNNAKKMLVKQIRELVDPCLTTHAGYCGLVCAFFPEHPKNDNSHPRSRKVRGGTLGSIIGFYARGVIDDVYVGLSTRDYDYLSVEDLKGLLPLARKFREIHGVKV